MYTFHFDLNLNLDLKTNKLLKQDKAPNLGSIAAEFFYNETE